MPPRATSPVGHLGSRQCQASGITIAIVDYAPNRVMPAHSHETLGISVVMRGLVEETAGSRTEVSGIASAVIKPPGTVHANRFGPEGARLLAMEMSPEQAEGFLGRHGFLDRWRWMRVMRALGVTCRGLSDLSQPLPMNGAAVENLAVELVAALDGDVLSSRGTPPSWLIRAHQRLDDDFATTFRVRELASEAGVHPVYLARRFRQHYGCSVLEYLRTVRLRAAMRELADAAHPLSQIAIRVGFSDQSHLTRALRATTGLTPHAYRRLVRSA